MNMYAIGILSNGMMSGMTLLTSDYKEACQIAKKENKNVYLHRNGFFYLKKILHKWNISNKSLGPMMIGYGQLSQRFFYQ